MDRSESQDAIAGSKFRKFKSESHIPPPYVGHYVPRTDAELRMEARFLDMQSRNLKLKNEEKELVERMLSYGNRKAKVIKLAMDKVEQRKAFNKTKLRREEQDQKTSRKLSIQSTARKQSMSLPSLKAGTKIIDTTRLNPPVEINMPEEQA